MGIDRRIVAALGLVAVGLVVVATTAIGASRHSLPTLRASATFPGGEKHAVKLEFSLLDRHDFRVLTRTSASSLTLGYPRKDHAKICAKATYRLRLVPGAADAVAYVRGALPQAKDEGVVTSATGGRVLGEPGATTTRAWRLYHDIRRSSRLVVKGVAASPVSVSTGHGSEAALRVLTLSAKMIHAGGACGGTNTFTVGPGILETLAIG
jgi:hypothetical protein